MLSPEALTDEQALALALEHGAGTAILPAQRAAAIRAGRQAYARMLAATEPVEAQGMPPLDPNKALGYDAIRYVSGYPESYVKSYAQAYGDARAAVERERCAKVCEAEHGSSTLYAEWLDECGACDVAYDRSAA